MITLAFIGAALVALVVMLFLVKRHDRRTWTDDEFEAERTGGTALGNAFLATQAILDGGASQAALEQRTVEPAEAEADEGAGEP